MTWYWVRSISLLICRSKPFIPCHKRRSFWRWKPFLILLILSIKLINTTIVCFTRERHWSQNLKMSLWRPHWITWKYQIPTIFQNTPFLNILICPMQPDGSLKFSLNEVESYFVKGFSCMWDKKYSFVGSSHIVHISIFPNVFKTTILKTNLLKMNFNSQD